MRPQNLTTKIFLDGGDPAETKETLNLLSFLDGQTTNPTLLAKNPYAKERFERGEKFTQEELWEFYKKIVTNIAVLIPNGSISIEVYADSQTSVMEMIKQVRDLNTWIPNTHIKLPITTAGLEAAEQLIKEGVCLNMTLCFSQAQAAAVYAATRGARKGQVFISPFVGRLDDKGLNGMDLVKNIIQMYQAKNSSVEVLAASLRTYDHFLYSLQLKSDIVTAPLKILKEWAEKGMSIPGDDYIYPLGDLRPISYQDFDFSKNWREFDIHHELTDKGLEKFSQDWNGLIK